MKKAQIALFFVTLFLTAAPEGLFAQSQWDTVLDRYQDIYNTCIELRERISKGEKVSSDRVSALLSEMNTLRERLKETSSSMTPRQKRRYSEIRNSYAACFGAVKETNIPDPTLLTRIPDSFQVRALSKTDNFDIKPAILPETKLKRFRAGIMGLCSISDNLCFGASVMAWHDRWGGYISAESDFSTVNASYGCNTSGQIRGGGIFWGDGTVNHSASCICAGVSYRIIPKADIYIGTGCAWKETDWRDISGQWAKVSDLTYKTPCAEFGARVYFEALVFSVGARFIPKSNEFSPVIGIGYRF